MSNFVNFNASPLSPLNGGMSGGLLSNITNMEGMSKNTMIMIGTLLFFAVLALFYYFYYIAPSINTKYKPNNEREFKNNQSSDKIAELLFFYADWCPHCKAAKPIWNDLKSEYETTLINGYKVIFTEIDCSEETEEVEKMMNKYSVEGYPTIKLLKDGQIIEYDAKPSKETITKFLNTVL